MPHGAPSCGMGARAGAPWAFSRMVTGSAVGVGVGVRVAVGVAVAVDVSAGVALGVAVAAGVAVCVAGSVSTRTGGVGVGAAIVGRKQKTPKTIRATMPTTETLTSAQRAMRSREGNLSCIIQGYHRLALRTSVVRAIVCRMLLLVLYLVPILRMKNGDFL